MLNRKAGAPMIIRNPGQAKVLRKSTKMNFPTNRRAEFGD
jgi:hypothetical protein